MTEPQERDLSAIGEAFKQIITHMKGGFPVWEDFVLRGAKLQRQLEHTIIAFNGFLEGFGKVADLATHAKGGTREIGTGLTNLVMWHKGQELKLREMNQALMNKLLVPLQGKIEEWKKTATQLDREHDKDVQKSMKEIKEVAKTTLKVSKSLESKMKKDKSSASEKCSALQQQLGQYQAEVDRRVMDTEERERRSLSRALLEERSWFCGFINAFSRVAEVEVGMLADLDRLQAILKDLDNAVARPNILPETSREFVENWRIPSSPAIRKRGLGYSTSISSHHSSQDSLSAPIPPPPPPPTASLPPPPLVPPGPIPPPLTSYFPPPPPTNFPLDGYSNHFGAVGLSSRSLTDDTYEPMTSLIVGLSVSPSQASLMSTSSHQSTESSRSLSPPIAPSRSPAQVRAQLGSLQEEENAPSTFQQTLMNKLRQRTNSLEGVATTSESPPINPRTTSLGGRPSPPVSKRPPPVPQKPARTPSLAGFATTANGRHSPQFTAPHHVLNPDSFQDNSDSEEESAFAKALRQKQLRKNMHINDRSTPKLQPTPHGVYNST